jgi:hypothetical protein
MSSSADPGSGTNYGPSHSEGNTTAWWAAAFAGGAPPAPGGAPRHDSAVRELPPPQEALQPGLPTLQQLSEDEGKEEERGEPRGAEQQEGGEPEPAAGRGRGGRGRGRGRASSEAARLERRREQLRSAQRRWRERRREGLGALQDTLERQQHLVAALEQQQAALRAKERALAKALDAGDIQIDVLKSQVVALSVRPGGGAASSETPTDSSGGSAAVATAGSGGAAAACGRGSGSGSGSAGAVAGSAGEASTSAAAAPTPGGGGGGVSLTTWGCRDVAHVVQSGDPDLEAIAGQLAGLRRMDPAPPVAVRAFAAKYQEAMQALQAVGGSRRACTPLRGAAWGSMRPRRPAQRLHVVPRKAAMVFEATKGACLAFQEAPGDAIARPHPAQRPVYHPVDPPLPPPPLPRARAPRRSALGQSRARSGPPKRPTPRPWLDSLI